MADNNNYGTGLTDAQAKEFHGFFMMGTIVWLIVAVVAHFLVWAWRPWFGAARPMLSMVEGAQSLIQSATTLLS